MAESEMAHRHVLEKQMIAADVMEVRLGQIFALLIGLTTIIAGVYAGVNGAQITGALIGTGGVIGLVSVFIYGRKRPND